MKFRITIIRQKFTDTDPDMIDTDPKINIDPQEQASPFKKHIPTWHKCLWLCICLTACICTIFTSLHTIRMHPAFFQTAHPIHVPAPNPGSISPRSLPPDLLSPLSVNPLPPQAPLPSFRPQSTVDSPSSPPVISHLTPGYPVNPLSSPRPPYPDSTFIFYKH